MIYEFIATITAGFGMAGIALIIRHLSKLAGKNAPKWLIPIFAGLGMLAFQIHQEYNWSQQQISKLPETVQVVKVVEGKQWYRPWSYVKPQVVRFMAVSSGKTIDIITDTNTRATLSNTSEDIIKPFNVYLFERRISTKIIPQLINCTQHSIAHTAGLSNTMHGTSSLTQEAVDTLTWESLAADDAILKAVCQDTSN